MDENVAEECLVRPGDEEDGTHMWDDDGSSDEDDCAEHDDEHVIEQRENAFLRSTIKANVQDAKGTDFEAQLDTDLETQFNRLREALTGAAAAASQEQQHSTQEASSKKARILR